MDPASWEPVPGQEWPIDAGEWVGTLPAGKKMGFLRVSAGSLSAVIPLKYVQLDLIGIHDFGSANYNGNCISCHGDRTKEVALDGQTPTAHSTMLPLFGEGNDRCLHCHAPGPDFLTYSTGGLRTQINMAETDCFSCHRAGSCRC